MPAHTHPVTPTAVPAFTGLGTLREPSATAVPAGSDQRNAQYAPAANADTQLGPASTPSTGITGGSQPFSTMQPYLGMHYIIAVEGIFPSRN
jgi:microcystin-dependent protein